MFVSGIVLINVCCSSMSFCHLYIQYTQYIRCIYCIYSRIIYLSDARDFFLKDKEHVNTIIGNILLSKQSFCLGSIEEVKIE